MAVEAIDHLLQRSELERVAWRVEESWLTVFEDSKSESASLGVYCAVLSPEAAKRALESPTWDLHPGEGQPGCSIRWQGDREIVEHHRFGVDNGVEPLVLCRDYHGMRPSHVEICEEFRLFQNAWWDTVHRRLVSFQDDGSERVIAREVEGRVEMHLAEVHEFLAARQAYLAIYIDSRRFSSLDLDEIPAEERARDVREEGMVLSFRVGAGLPPAPYRTFSRLLGKVLLAPLEREPITAGFAGRREEEYPEFIIGTSATTGKPIRHTCDPRTLATIPLPDRGRGAVPYCTPVFFRRDVLQKYVEQPRRYSVEPGRVRCGTLWSMEIDNDREDCVIAFLGDLGEYLPESERFHWRAHNIRPDGSMSESAIRRSFLNQFAKPRNLEARFKEGYRRLQETWQRRFGWPLYLPLHEDDVHNLKRIHVPFNAEQNEFDGLVLALAKVLIEPLNVKALRRPGKKSEDAAGIGDLGCFLVGLAQGEEEEHVLFLRDLQSLRSTGVAHGKGKKYEAAKRRFGIDVERLDDMFRQLLTRACEFVEFLNRLAEGSPGQGTGAGD